MVFDLSEPTAEKKVKYTGPTIKLSPRAPTTEEIQEHSANLVEDWLKRPKEMREWAGDLYEGQLERYIERWEMARDTGRRISERAERVLEYLYAERQERLERAVEEDLEDAEI